MPGYTLQLLGMYTGRESYSAQRYGRTDGQTTGFYANSRSYCVLVAYTIS